MLKSDLLSIDKFLQENLNSREKNFRKNIANSIESKISYILKKNSVFTDFKISRSYTNSLNIYLKNEEERISFNIKFLKNSSNLEIIVFAPIFYYFDDKYPVKISKKVINKIASEYQIKEINNFGEYEVVLHVERIGINNDIEENLEKHLKNLHSSINELKQKLDTLFNQFNEHDFFYFDLDYKFTVEPEEFFHLSYQINSIELNNTNLNNELFQIFSDSNEHDKKRYQLIIAHLNLPLSKRFLAIDREFLTYEENVIFNQQIMKGFITSINKYDRKIAKFSTYSYTWLLQAYTRVTDQIIRNRMKNKYGVTPTFKDLFTFKTEYKKENDEFANFQKLLSFAEKDSEKKLKIKKQRERKILKDNLSKSAHFKLCELVTEDRIYGRNKLNQTALHIYNLSEICLIGKEKNILQRRYYPELNNLQLPTTPLQIIGDEFGITRERVRQIEKDALSKIKVAYSKFPPSKKINKSWLKPITEIENKKGISKALISLGKNNIFFMGQIKKLSLEEFTELYKNFEISNQLIEKLYFQLIPIKTLRKSYKDLKIEILNLSNRSFNALKNQNIQYVSQINIEELEYIPNLGQKSINEIRAKLLDLNNLK